MVQNKAEIASDSIHNPRASRALERALDPGRKGLRAHMFTPPPPPNTVLALSGYTGVSSGPSEKKFENPCSRCFVSSEASDAPDPASQNQQKVTEPHFVIWFKKGALGQHG